MNRRHWKTPSLTTRVALLFALFAAALLLLVGIVLERAVDQHFDELDDHELASKLTVIGHLIARTTSEEALRQLPQRLDDALVGHERIDVLVLNAKGSVLHATDEARFPTRWRLREGTAGSTHSWEQDGTRFIGRKATFVLPFLDASPSERASDFASAEPSLPESHRPEAHRPGSHPTRSLGSASSDAGAADVRALVAFDTSHHTHFLDRMRYHLWLAILLAALLAGGLGWLAAHRGLAPLRRVTRTAAGLSAERLGERLSEQDAPAEMLDLLRAFNGMLDRLEATFQRLSDFSADIAHELRTPVSNLMTETQVALSRARSAEDYRETLHSNLEEFDRLARMIGDMLFLAKADNGLLPQPAQTLALEVETHELLEFYEALAEDHGVQLRLTGAATVVGDRLMLRRALSNLLSNALRHTPAGGCVVFSIETEGDQARLCVQNPGPSIAPDRLPLLFDRFHRVDPERSGHGEGAGLGLAITRSIVQAHGGRIAVESGAGLTTFVLHLPLASAMPE